MPVTLPKRNRKPRNDPYAPGLELDRGLAGRIVKGEREALVLFADRHISAVYRYVARYVGPGHEELASEVVRSSLADGLKHMKSYAVGRTSTPMRLWLLKRASHHLARRRKRLKSLVDGPTPTGESAELTALRRAMLTLPARQAAALSIALFEELPPEEMARALGVSPARAMRLLRGALRRIDRAIAVEESR